MSPFDREPMTSYWCSIVTTALSRLLFGGHGHGVPLLHIATYSAACQSLLAFLRATRSIERISYGNVSGWLAGCLSHAGIVSKRINLAENFFDHLKAPSI